MGWLNRALDRLGGLFSLKMSMRGVITAGVLLLAGVAAVMVSMAQASANRAGELERRLTNLDQTIASASAAAVELSNVAVAHRAVRYLEATGSGVGSSLRVSTEALEDSGRSSLQAVSRLDAEASLLRPKGGVSEEEFQAAAARIGELEPVADSLLDLLSTLQRDRNEVLARLEPLVEDVVEGQADYGEEQLERWQARLSDCLDLPPTGGGDQVSNLASALARGACVTNELHRKQALSGPFPDRNVSVSDALAALEESEVDVETVVQVQALEMEREPPPKEPEEAATDEPPRPRTGSQPTRRAPEPPAAPATRSYTVQPGDNLYRIALRFGVALPDLLRANGLADGAVIEVGQEMVIPGG